MVAQNLLRIFDLCQACLVCYVLIVHAYSSNFVLLATPMVGFDLE